MTQLQAGDMAPDFKSTTQDGAALTLADLKGQRTILYFYPKDNTSGCTLEAKSLRDGRAELARMGFRIIGVSPDSEKSHRNFCAKHDLNFTLLADTDHSVTLPKSSCTIGVLAPEGSKAEASLTFRLRRSQCCSTSSSLTVVNNST